MSAYFYSPNVIDLSYLFAEKQVENSIAQIRRIADRAASNIDALTAATEAKRQNINALLDQMSRDARSASTGQRG